MNLVFYGHESMCLSQIIYSFILNLPLDDHTDRKKNCS